MIGNLEVELDASISIGKECGVQTLLPQRYQLY